MKKIQFSSWIRAKQLEYINREGKKRTDKAFAEWLGVTDKTMGHYLNGRSLPKNENVVKLANKLGWELYRILGWPNPELPGTNGAVK